MLFVELVEKCIEPWKQVSWSISDLTAFLDAYTHCALQLDCLRYLFRLSSIKITQKLNFTFLLFLLDYIYL